MNATSPSPADPLAAAAESHPAANRIRVWDAPVRLFHALMLLCFAGAWLSAESERWRLLHTTLGYTMVALVLFRLVWGIVGTRYARFADFVRGPAAIAHHLKAMLRREPEAGPGHNPAGALAIVAMLGLTLVIGASGWAVFNDVGGGWLEEAHELAANALMAVVGLHVAGVLLVSVLGRQNLVAAMVSGRKRGAAGDGIASTRRRVAALMWVAVLGFWAWQWQAAPASASLAAAAPPATTARTDDDGGHG